MRAALLLCLNFLCVGCYTTSVTKLITAEPAMKIPPTAEPVIIDVNAIDWETTPVLVKYGVVTGLSGEPSYLPGAVSRRAKKDLQPDLVILSPGAPIYSGAIAVYNQWSGRTTPIYTQVLFGTCFRLAKAKLGCRTDGEGVVYSIDADSKARAAGIQEGDRLLSIDGRYFDSGMGMLAWDLTKPVHVVWLRPEHGRMEADVELVPNKDPLPRSTVPQPREPDDSSVSARRWGTQRR